MDNVTRRLMPTDFKIWVTKIAGGKLVVRFSDGRLARDFKAAFKAAKWQAPDWVVGASQRQKLEDWCDGVVLKLAETERARREKQGLMMPSNEPLEAWVEPFIKWRV
jgi:hypothetical protein